MLRAVTTPAARSEQKKVDKPLLIGELAKLASVSPDSIRFYEREGLLPKPARLASGYRAYDRAAAKRLSFIKRAQQLGFSLQDIRQILALRERGEPACQCVVRKAQETLKGAEAKLDELQSFVNRLRTQLRRWKRVKAHQKNAAAEFCSLIESSSGGDDPVPAFGDSKKWSGR